MWFHGIWSTAKRPLCLLACWNRAHCLSKTLECEPIVTLKEHRKFLAKGGSTVSDVSHLVYFALVSPAWRAENPKPPTALVPEKRENCCAFLLAKAARWLNACLKRGRGNNPWEKYMFCPQKPAAFNSFSLLANTPVAVKSYCFTRAVFI